MAEMNTYQSGIGKAKTERFGCWMTDFVRAAFDDRESDDFRARTRIIDSVFEICVVQRKKERGEDGRHTCDVFHLETAAGHQMRPQTPSPPCVSHHVLPYEQARNCL